MWRRVCSFMRAPRRDEGGQRDRRMIHQPLADAGQGRRPRECPSRADGRPGRCRRACRWAGVWMAPDDRITSRGAELLLLAVDHRLHADAARALEQQRLHLGVGRDGEVGPLARLGIEIAHRRRHALLLGVGMGDRESSRRRTRRSGRAGTSCRPACRPRPTALAWPVQCSSGMRRTGMRPSLPCHGPSKSRSRSTFLK